MNKWVFLGISFVGGLILVLFTELNLFSFAGMFLLMFGVGCFGGYDMRDIINKKAEAEK